MEGEPKFVTVQVEKEIREKLQVIKRDTGIPIYHFVREAVNEKLARKPVEAAHV